MTWSLTGGAFAAVALLLAAFASVLVLAHVLRRVRGWRQERRAEPARRRLLALAAGEQDAADELARMPSRMWRAAEPTAVSLVGKIRGEARESLISVFERRGTTERAMRQLDRRGAVRRATAAELLGALQRREAVPRICRLLGDFDSEVRVVAARSLGQIGDASAVEPLLDALHRHGLSQQVVAHALMRMGPEAEPRLIAALSDSNAQARFTAVEVLGLRHALPAVSAVSDRLRHDPIPEVRIRAARALGLLGTRATMTPLLNAARPDQPPALRAVAARALGELGDPAAGKRLRVLLSDPVHGVAHSAATALLRLGNPGIEELRAQNPHTAAGAHAREALAAHALEQTRRPVAGSGGP